MPKPILPLSQRQAKLDTLIQDMISLELKYAHKPTAQKRLNVLNMKNRVRVQRDRVKKAKSFTGVDHTSIQI